VNNFKVPVSQLVCSLLLGALFVSTSGCVFRRVVRTKDLAYVKADAATRKAEQRLNIFAPRKPKELKNVLVFIHGGRWNSGDKDQYDFFGNRWARKGVVTVIIDYPLSPQASYNQMATSAAQAVQWVQQNIRQYGGDPNRIFVSGHSAGGHLASLISLRNEYFDSLQIKNPIKGTILIDAAGLDMYGYLQEQGFEDGHTYLKTFTANPQEWKKASPIFHLHENMPPMLIYRGGSTYSSIEKSTEKFVSALKNYVPRPRYQVQPGKGHIGMITQFFFTWNPRYDEILRFMEE
jgi:acetyl esterase/lipase